MGICVTVCMYVCVHVCVCYACVWLCVWACVCIRACMFACMCMPRHARARTCTCACLWCPHIITIFISVLCHDCIIPRTVYHRSFLLLLSQHSFTLHHIPLGCDALLPGPLIFVLMILGLFEGFLFILFTCTMFWSQIYSICTDETVSTHYNHMTWLSPRVLWTLFDHPANQTAPLLVKL